MQQATLNRNLRETFTLWVYTGAEDQRGRKTYLPPVAVKGRWEDREERYVDEKGTAQISRSTVFVDRDVRPGSRLLRGSSSAPDPEPVEGTFLVRWFVATPTLYVPTIREKRALL